jgi:hypothetical protein
VKGLSHSKVITIAARAVTIAVVTQTYTAIAWLVVTSYIYYNNYNIDAADKSHNYSTISVY